MTAAAPKLGRPYRHAHWYVAALVALAAIGFWRDEARAASPRLRQGEPLPASGATSQWRDQRRDGK